MAIFIHLNATGQRLVEYIGAVHNKATNEELTELRKKLKIEALLADIGPLIDGTLEGAVRVADIVKNLRRLSFSQTNEKQQFHIDRVLETAVRWAVRPKQIKTEIKIDIEPDLIVLGNEGQVHQVIVNLVDNAMGAMREVAMPELSVRAFRDGNEIKIEISDNGAGISDEILDRIFEPFLQQNGSAKVPVWGSGSAMASSGSNGGELRAENRAEGGARFSFALPSVR